MRNPLPAVLVLMLVFANVVCACPVEGDGSSSGGHHEQHEQHTDTAPAESDCADQSCLDCVVSAVANLPDPIASPGPLSKIEFDDDPWVALAQENSHPGRERGGSSAPPPESIILAVSTPVQLADLLLE